MRFNFIPQKFKPTKKKLILSILIAIIADLLYWLIIASTNLKDMIKPIIDWYVENIGEMLFSTSGIIILLIVFLLIYIISSLIQKKK